jgi:hypothetical protein
MACQNGLLLAPLSFGVDTRTVVCWTVLGTYTDDHSIISSPCFSSLAEFQGDAVSLKQELRKEAATQGSTTPYRAI